MRNALAEARYGWRHRQARRRYDEASPRRPYLDEGDLDRLLAEFGHIEARPFLDYSDGTLEQRAGERASRLGQLAEIRGSRVLEIGAADGMVLAQLLRLGAREAIAVDIQDYLVPPARTAGVTLVTTSAESMPMLEPASFDLIYSWGTLEHVPDVAAVLRECRRLLRSGGVLHVEAGPLFFSPWGAHQQAQVRIPYLHLLFPDDLLVRRLPGKKAGGTTPGFFQYTNGLPASAYLREIQVLPPDLVLADLWHGYDWYSARIISRYPEVFRAKRVNFDDFFVDSIRMVIRKR